MSCETLRIRLVLNPFFPRRLPDAFADGWSDNSLLVRRFCYWGRPPSMLDLLVAKLIAPFLRTSFRAVEHLAKFIVLDQRDDL